MPKPKKPNDVLILHTPRDTALALEVVDACRASGLESVTSSEVLPDADHGDALWEAVAESRAIVTILSPSGPTAAMWLLLGAAQAWNKPIYGLVTDPASTRSPLNLVAAHLYTKGRLQDVIQSIKISAQQWTEEDRAFLAQLYAAIGTPVDQLALDPKRRDDLVKRFSKGRGKPVSGEQLLSELFRLRKQGALVRSRSVRRLKAGTES